MNRKAFRVNKTNISSRHRKVAKKMYFENLSTATIAEKLWYKHSVIEKFVASRATKVYYDWNNVARRRCTICKVYRLEEYYNSNGLTKYLQSECKICGALKGRNKFILEKNLWITRSKEKRKESREKWKWKHKARKSVLCIIWILNANWKRLQGT